MRVAFIKNGVVINVIEVEDINQLPDWAVVGLDEQENPIRKADCDLYIETEVGSKNDLYEQGVGFYRQYDMNVESIEEVLSANDIEELQGGD
jgi:hypothetical protein